jgi:hypothetical protein
MSFKSREKKRRRKLAMANARAKHGETMASRHYLTVVSRDCCCNRCGASLRAGRDDCVYRHTPREILCLGCATTQKIRYRLSRRWEQRKEHELQRGSRLTQ